jgi:hypothetical protein
MAPVPEPSSLLTSFTNLLRRTPSPAPVPSPLSLSPKALHLASRAQDLLRRELTDPGAGVIPPTRINNKAFFAFFGLIGVFFVCTGIWFFFWAKNGGFYFNGKKDWDDYKSTVLRRKGPNGTTLSGATASTDLGGGSVVHGQGKKSRWGRKKGGKSVADSRYKDFEEGSEWNGSELSSEMSEIKWQAQAAAAAIKKQQKDKDAAKKKKSRFGGRGAPSVDEEMDIGTGVDDTIRAYRHEKPARVGGINKPPDSSAFDGSTNDGSNADLLSNREHTPTNTPTKVRKERKDTYTGGTGGIRKVVSTSSPAAKTGSSFWTRTTGSDRKKEEEDHIKAEARKLQDKGRAAQRRDFSFQAGDDMSSSGIGGGSEDADAERRARREERRARRAVDRANGVNVPGSYAEGSEMGSDLSGDVGTKSYHHPIPGLSSDGRSDYAEERRRKRNGGYRRD